MESAATVTKRDGIGVGLGHDQISHVTLHATLTINSCDTPHCLRLRMRDFYFWDVCTTNVGSPVSMSVSVSEWQGHADVAEQMRPSR